MSRVEPDSTKDSHQAFTGYAEPESVRLSVNLAPHVAKELRRQAALGDGTATLAVNNAILLAKIMLDARARGRRFSCFATRGADDASTRR